MPTLFITEFDQEGVDRMGRIAPVARQLPVAEQTVAVSGTSAQSAALNEATALVRLHTDTNCSVKLGTNPTATATSMRMAIGQTEYFAVQPNSGLKVAVITNS